MAEYESVRAELLEFVILDRKEMIDDQRKITNTYMQL